MYLAEQFWCRWRCNYVTKLQERQKWRIPNHKISIGDVVLLKGRAKRNDWPLGRILELETSEDGLIRRVKVKLGSRHGRPSAILERSIRDVILIVPNSQS